ncbi:MAG: hypothetical protein D3924_05970 [Candidatus Electrothrix sp. AR4]|nr:hypothetical protein [Candidatus Electrothrix sp. AR4]
MPQFIYFTTSILTLLILFLLSALPTLAAGIGKKVCEPYKPLVVQITTKFSHGSRDHGFGFIVGEQDNKLYIVTANHVVRSNNPDKSTDQVLLRFSWDPGGRGKEAELLDTVYRPLDLALLRIDKSIILGTKRVNWKGRVWCRRWQEEEKVWFIGRARKWYVPPDRRSGILLNTEADLQGFIHIDIDSIQPGTSGAPLLIKNGLVGMIVNDSPEEAQAVNIDHIRRFVAVENPYPWNLVKCDSNTKRESSRTKKSNKAAAWIKKQDTFQKINNTTGNNPVFTSENLESKIISTAQPLRSPEIHQKNSPVHLEPATDSIEQSVQSSPKQGDLLFEPLTEMDFVHIPKGCFKMGSPKGEKGRFVNERPIHQVCVDSFWMGKYEVTKGQWSEIIGKIPAQSRRGDLYPVELVTWEETQTFIRKLNKRTGKVFRLPTEAEWEYAARAGTSTARYWGNDISCDKAMYENYSGDSCVDYVKKRGLPVNSTAPVGSYPPNQFGLYDMLGNVWEWCADWYNPEYYRSSPRENPTGPASGSDRVIRGGSWRYEARIVRAASRNWFPPDKRNDFLGFRLVFSDQ